MTVQQLLTRVNRSIDWSRWTIPFFGPLASMHTLFRSLDQDLTVAHNHPDNIIRQFRLELAARHLRRIRDHADELELVLGQAREALAREIALERIDLI